MLAGKHPKHFFFNATRLGTDNQDLLPIRMAPPSLKNTFFQDPGGSLSSSGFSPATGRPPGHPSGPHPPPGHLPAE